MLLQERRMRDLAQQQGCASVPKVVQSLLGKPSALQKKIEAVAGHIIPGQRLARLGGEYEAVILP